MSLVLPSSEESAHAMASRDRPIRVCFLIDDLKIGGVERQLLLLLDSLDRSRIEPRLCLLNGTGELSRSLEPNDIPVMRLGVRSLHHPSTAAQGIRFARFLRRERVDVLQMFFADSTYFGTLFGKLARVPCAARSRLDIGFWVKPIDRWLGRACSRVLDRTLTNCEACRQSVIADEHAAPESVVVIPNGVVLDRFKHIPEPQATASHGATRRVGVVANLSPMKNHELLVRAAEMLATAHPGLQYQLAGEGDLRPELEHLIKTLGLHDRFRLLGSVTDIPAFLSGLDVAVLCSRTEGAPNAIMEYMAAARPIVATAVGGVEELVVNEEHGLIVPSESVEHLADAIDRLLRNPQLAARLAKNARQRAFREYSVHAMARRYEAFYLEMFRAKTGRSNTGMDDVRAAQPDGREPSCRVR